MVKKNTIFFCKECGYESTKWLGQCPNCKEWNTFVEGENIKNNIGIDLNSDNQISDALPISKIKDKIDEKIITKISEFDNVLGGGIVVGSLTLIGGPPGIGKSTLLLQVAKNVGISKKVIYISGEESLSQIKLRANRIGKFTDDVLFLCETDLSKIVPFVIKQKPSVLIIDSIQTLVLNQSDKISGSVQQIRNCASVLFRVAKEYDISILIIGHITKDGQVAGPKILEHIVDTVLYFDEDSIKNLRLLRCKKNRFGSNNELAVFEIEKNGLIEVKNPSDIFLEGRPSNATGCVVTCAIDSNRPIFLEVQALVTKSGFGMAKRTINGSDYNKLSLLIAIIEKRLNIPLYEYDIYINITGGIKIKDTSIDLAIIMAIISSYKDKALGTDLVYCGEVGLSGEVRSIRNCKMRINEAIKLGYKRIFLPKSNVDKLANLDEMKEICIKPVATIM